jgi:hypothetical protein
MPNTITYTPHSRGMDEPFPVKPVETTCELLQ